MTWFDVLLKYWSRLSEEVQEKVREMFTLFARTMELYARVIRGKMVGEGEGGNPRRA